MEVYYVDTDKVPEIAEKYGVMSLPTMLLFKDGKPTDKMVGYHPQQEVKSFLTQ